MKMKEINKIVQLSDLQYEKLLKDRQIEIDGEIKVWEPDTLYVTPNNNYQWLFNKFYETAIKPNEVYHTPMNMKSLEQEYEDLMIENNELIYLSAIGYIAILKNGDVIEVTEPNKGIFYINGSVVTNDYTYTGDGYEVVNVWVFEDNYKLELNDKPTFSINELNVRSIATIPVVGNNYKNNTFIIKTYNSNICGTATKKLITNGSETFNLNTSNSFKTLEEVESDCVTFPGSGSASPLYDKPNLKKAVFPNLQIIQGGSSSGGATFLASCTNSELEIYFPNLRTINNHNSGSKAAGAFGNVKNVILPPSVISVGAYNFANNQTIILNCNRASFNTNWCYSGTNAPPPTNFTMCDDWQASINIAVAAKNHTIDWFIDLFTNNLADMTGQDAPQINIPLAIFEALSPEQLAIAQNKNWTVTGL